MRLGWITCNLLFQEKLVTYTDSGVQHPHAFGQVFISEMLGIRGWQTEGFVTWVKSLCQDYQRRRNLLLDVFRREVEPSHASASAPQAGMFVWVEIHLDRHPRYCKSEEEREPGLGRTNILALMEELLSKFMEAGLVVMPGSIFAIPDDLECIDYDGYIPIRDVSPQHSMRDRSSLKDG